MKLKFKMIKVLHLILFNLVFSRDHQRILSKTYRHKCSGRLGGPLLAKESDREIINIWELFSLSVMRHLWKNIPLRRTSLGHFRIQHYHLILGLQRKIYFVLFLFLFFKFDVLNFLSELWYDALHLSGY